LDYLLDPQRNLPERRTKTRAKDKIKNAQDDLIHRAKRMNEAQYKYKEGDTNQIMKPRRNK